jgi:hypothetical protein
MVARRGHPFARCTAQSSEIDAGIVVGEFLQFFERGGREGLSAGAIPARIMMKRGGELNQALQKSLFGFRRGQPDFFPDFVRFEELRGIEEHDPALKFFVMYLARL